MPFPNKPNIVTLVEQTASTIVIRVEHDANKSYSRSVTPAANKVFRKIARGNWALDVNPDAGEVAAYGYYSFKLGNGDALVSDASRYPYRVITEFTYSKV